MKKKEMRRREDQGEWGRGEGEKLRKKKERKKRPPTISSTRMRLINIPMNLPIEIFAKALTENVKGFIGNSEMFETYSHSRKMRNGNLTFYVEGTVHV